MPPSPPRSIPRGLTITKIRKFIPQSWKQPLRPIINESVTNTLTQKSSYEIVLHSAASLLSTCVEFNEFVAGQQVHGHCISSGLEFDHVLVPKLVTFYSSFNLLEEAQTITYNSNVLHSLPWNVLIDSYVRNKRFHDAISTYKRMVSKGIQPDEYTYPSILKACGSLQDFSSGRVVHSSIEVTSHRESLFVSNALISMYSRFSNVDTARKLFNRMSEKDSVTWNTLINCYASQGNYEEAYKVLYGMHLSGIEETVVTTNTMVGVCLQMGDYFAALNLVVNMRNYDDVAMINGLKACSYIGALRWGKELHCVVIRCGLYRIENVRNSLITMYSRCNNGLRDAFIMFEESEVNSVSTWNCLISGFTYNERLKDASLLFKGMLRAGVNPNYVTLASILGVCSRMGNLQHGKELHCYVLKRRRFKDSLVLWNSVLDTYAKSGRMVSAKRVFVSMRKKDKVTYTSLIDGYGMLGEGEVALAWFNDMYRSNIKPDHVTMVAVLSACSHSNLVCDGERQFEMMRNMFGITPRLEHYSCMVDLYCKGGYLVRARDVIRRSPYEPSNAMFATLLIACLDHGNRDIGEWVADKLFEMRPEKLSHYSLIADMYEAVGSSSKLAKVVSLIMAHELDGLSEPWINSIVCSSSMNQEQGSDEERLGEVGKQII